MLVNMTSDLELLGQFAREKSQDAFTALVQRHVNLVHSAALRQVRSPQLAEEVAQSVFADLARVAATPSSPLSGNDASSPPTLTPWLYAVTRRTAIDVIRKESRRQLREQIAVEMTNMNVTAASGTGVPPGWTEIEPLLDDAMAALDETDRSAILLRYFENKSLREVGEALGTNDDAAQKRVSRAVEQLREFFLKRKVTIGAGGLAVVISANAVQAAPVGLATAISTTAILAGTAVHTSTVIAATKAIAMTTLQKAIIGSTLAAAAGTGIFEAHQASRLREQNQTLQQQQASMAEQVQQLQRERDAATNRVASLADELAKAKSNNLELMKLRGEVTQSRSAVEIENDPAFQKARLWMAKEAKLREQFELHPEQWIPEMKFLSKEEWLDQARKADLDTADGMRCALSNVRVAAAYDFAGKMSRALQIYMNAHNQELPDSTAQLSAYFKPPLNEADSTLSRYEMLNSEQQANTAYQGAAIIQKTLVDHLDSPVLIGVRAGTQTVSCLQRTLWPPVLPDELQPVLKSYFDANNQRSCMTVYDLEPYATTPAQKDALNKLIKAASLPH